MKIKKIFAYIVYGLNILFFVVILGKFIESCYSLLTRYALSVQLSGNVDYIAEIISTVLFAVLIVLLFFVIRKLRKYKIQERFNGILVLGIVGIIGTLGIFFMISLLTTCACGLPDRVPVGALVL